MKILSGQGFEVKVDTSCSEFLGEIKKFGFFSGVEFKCLDPNQSIFFIREIGVLERLGKMFRSVLSRDIYRASGDALLDLSKKNMVLAGILGRSVFEAREKPLSARELSDKFKLEEKKFKSREASWLAVPSEGKMIVTDACSTDFRQAHEVDLSVALTQENFLADCKSVLSKASNQSSEDVLIVKLRPVSDNDEPSDDAINKLLLVIDEHQKSKPSSRLMIVTDGDRLLYERMLNLKIQHDAKKFLQSNKPNLSAMDLLMIPSRGDNLVTLDPIDESRLPKFSTQFKNVSVCITNDPEMIQSDLSVVISGTLSHRYQTSEEKPAAASKLSYSVAEEGDGSPVGAAFVEEKRLESTKSTLFAARFPTMDLPVKRLILFQTLRGSWTPKSPDYENNVNKVKDFYLEELRKERGRVVIESPVASYACEGLRRAVEELREKKEGPAEIIIATLSNKSSIFESFQPQSDSNLME